jgi:nucleotide-binding universal stress UspA family protein
MTYKRILVPFDSSPYAEKALALAARLAKDFNAQLHILSVVEELPSTPRMERTGVKSTITGEMVGIRECIKELYQQLRHDALKMLELKKERVEKEHISTKTIVVVGYPPDKIIEYIKDQGIDLAVMGTRGRRGLARITGIGSVARKVSENAACPVILVH